MKEDITVTCHPKTKKKREKKYRVRENLLVKAKKYKDIHTHKIMDEKNNNRKIMP